MFLYYNSRRVLNTFLLFLEMAKYYVGEIIRFFRYPYIYRQLFRNLILSFLGGKLVGLYKILFKVIYNPRRIPLPFPFYL